MSFSRTMDSRYDDNEESVSPNNIQARSLGHETLFQFFRKKSKRDLDKSFSSARKSGRKTEKTSPNVKLLQELNTSSSPFKGKRSTSPFKPAAVATNQSPFKLLSPFNGRDESSSDHEESSKAVVNKKAPSNPLFVKLIQNGSHRKKKSDAPTAPTVHDKYNMPVSRTKPQEKNTHNNRLNSHPDLRHEEKAQPTKKHHNAGNRFSTPDGRKNEHYDHGRHDTASTRQQTEPDRRVFTSVNKENDQSHVDLLKDINSRLASYANSHVRSPKKYADMVDDLDAELRRNSPSRAREQHAETVNKRARASSQAAVQSSAHVTPKRTQRVNKENHPIETNWAKNTLRPYIEEYEQKRSELGEILQRQFHQIGRLGDRIHNIDGSDTEDLKFMVEDLELTSVTISKCLKDGLFNVHGAVNLTEKVERQYKKEIRELNEALEQVKATLKTDKCEYDLKLEELLSYNDNLRKQASAHTEKGRSNSKEARVRRHHEDQSADVNASMEVMRNDIRQLSNKNQNLEIHLKELEKENQVYRQQNYRLKESEEALKDDVALLRSRLDEALLKSNRQQLAIERKDHKRSSRENGKRQASPGRQTKEALKKSGRGGAGDHDEDGARSEVEYLSYRLDILTKENEDLVRRLTDKVFIERENKTLLIKNQELTEALKTKVKENDHLTKTLNELQERFVEGTGYPIYTAVSKHYAPDDKARNRMTQW